MSSLDLGVEVGDLRGWWSERRLQYNVGLAIAGALSFACYVGVVLWGISIRAISEPAGINGLTMILQGIGYLFLMLVANAFYSLGSISESILKPANVLRYRRITYGLGFWFSMLLPFSVPALVAYSCLTHHGPPQR